MGLLFSFMRHQNLEEQQRKRNRQFFGYIREGNIDQLRVLINSLDADELTNLLQMRDPEDLQRTALTMAITEEHTQIVELLLQNGADPHLTVFGRLNNMRMAVTPLWVATNVANLEMCRLLIAHGANANLGTDTGDPPLANACVDGSLDLVTFLVENGADVNHLDSDGFTPLMIIAGHTQYSIDVVRFVLSQGANVEQMDFTGEHFALRGAGARGHLELCRVLVEEADADINQQSMNGRTALIIASIWGHLDIVQFLIEHGADCDHTDVHGYSSLMHAVRNRRTEVAQHLLSIGASTDQMGIDGKRAMDLAEEGGLAEMVDIFRAEAEPQQNEQQM